MTQASTALTVPADLIELGRIVSAYGVKGWIKVQPYSSQAEVLLAATTWWLARPPAPGASGRRGVAGQSPVAGPSPVAGQFHVAGQSHVAGQPAAVAASSTAPAAVFDAVKVLTSRPQGSTVVAAFEGLEDRDFAHAMRGVGVYISRADFPAVAPGEYYWVDLLGCLVYGDGDGVPALLGRVVDVTENAAHALLKVERLVQQDGDAGLQPDLSSKGREQALLVPFVDAHLLAVDLVARRIDTNWPLEYE